MRSIIVFFLFAFCAVVSMTAQSPVDSTFFPSKPYVVVEKTLLYEFNVINKLVNSNGIGSRVAVIPRNTRRVNIGVVADWRIIPGLVERKTDASFKSLFYPALSEYHGPDSLAFSQLHGALGGDEKLKFSGYIKGAIGIFVDYKLRKGNSIRLNSSLIGQSFRITGNDNSQAPYVEPGYYWLNTGLGYSLRLEYHKGLGQKKVLGKNNSFQLLMGMGLDSFKYEKLSFEDIPLTEALNITIQEKNARLYNLKFYVGFSFF